MRRKAPKTINLPDELTEVATAYAEATSRSLSSLIEDLLREELRRSNALPAPTPELVMRLLEKRTADRAERKKGRAIKVIADASLLAAMKTGKIAMTEAPAHGVNEEELQSARRGGGPSQPRSTRPVREMARKAASGR